MNAFQITGVLLIGFIIGAVLVFVSVKYYIRYIRPKRKIDSLFDLNDYNSQQLAKMLSARTLNNYTGNEGLQSIDPLRLPLAFQSQWCEDVILYNYFNKKKNGFYIEIGAFDGVRLSNTYFFECIGWKGILIEPQPIQFNKCKINRPNSVCYDVAIGKETGPVELNIIEDPNYETWSFIGKDKSAKEVGFKYNTILVDKKELKNIIPPDVGSIDFISIDVEGFEFEILQTIDFQNHCPEVILLENNSAEIRNYLAGFGYGLTYKTWINFFYTKDKDAFKNKSVWNELDLKILG